LTLLVWRHVGIWPVKISLYGGNRLLFCRQDPFKFQKKLELLSATFVQMQLNICAVCSINNNDNSLVLKLTVSIAIRLTVTESATEASRTQ